MFGTLLLLLAALAFSPATTREVITVKTERIEVVRFDPEISEINVRSFKYNRTTTVINGTFNLKVPVTPGDKVAVQAYKFASNEYRLFPVTFDPEICASFKINFFGMRNLQSCGNFSVGCPIKRGIYEICNWTPDYERFPPHLVTGQYMIEVRFILKQKEAGAINWYIKVEDVTILSELFRNKVPSKSNVN